MTRWLVAALLAFSGCAYALSGPDPGRPRNLVPECDTSKGLVILDGAMATGMGVATLSLVSGSEPAVALLPLAIGAIYLGGAVKGNTAVNRCRVAMDEFARYPGERLVVDDDDEPRPRRRSDPRAPREHEPPAAAQAQPAAQSQQVPYPQAAQPQPQPQPVQQPAVPAPPARAGASRPLRMRPRPPAADDDWSDFWREVP